MQAFLLIIVYLFVHTWGDKANNRILASVITLSRNGDQTPLYRSPDNETKKVLMGDLTEEGMAHSYKLGNSLRKFYGSEFFSFYDYDECSSHRNRFFAFHSTARKRTRESLQYHLQGAFNTTFKPVENSTLIYIPVIVSSEIRRLPCDEKKVFQVPPKHPSQQILFDTHREELVDFQKKFGLEKPDVLDIETISQLSTFLILHEQLNYSLPDGMDENQFQHLADVYRKLKKSEHPYDDPELCTAIAGDFIHRFFFDYPHHLLKALSSCQAATKAFYEEKKKNESLNISSNPTPPPPPPPPNCTFIPGPKFLTLPYPPRYTHLSAYESTIIEKLGCLGYDFTDVFPEYGAMMVIEMYLDLGDNYTVTPYIPPPIPWWAKPRNATNASANCSTNASANASTKASANASVNCSTNTSAKTSVPPPASPSTPTKPASAPTKPAPATPASTPPSATPGDKPAALNPRAKQKQHKHHHAPPPPPPSSPAAKKPVSTLAGKPSSIPPPPPPPTKPAFESANIPLAGNAVLPHASHVPAGEPSMDAISFRILVDLHPGDELNLTEWLPPRCKGISPCPAKLMNAPFEKLSELMDAKLYEKQYCFHKDDGEKLENKYKGEEMEERDKIAKAKRIRDGTGY